MSSWSRCARVSYIVACTGWMFVCGCLVCVLVARMFKQLRHLHAIEELRLSPDPLDLRLGTHFYLLGSTSTVGRAESIFWQSLRKCLLHLRILKNSEEYSLVGANPLHSNSYLRLTPACTPTFAPTMRRDSIDCNFSCQSPSLFVAMVSVNPDFRLGLPFKY